MTPSVLRNIGYACFGLSGLLLVVGISIYIHNSNQIANARQALNNIGGGFGTAITSGASAWSAGAIASIVFAVFAGIGGGVCLVMAKNMEAAGPYQGGAPMSPAPAPSSNNLSDELAKLQGLHRSGALTDEEFAKAKAAAMAKYT